MNEQLIDLLQKGNHSIVICRHCGNFADNDSCDCPQLLTYDTKGIATLLQIVNDDSGLLRGATVVDKVVGKAAAALLILGGTKELHALLISRGALDLLATTDVKVSYGRQTDHIMNSAQTDWCPMEKACRDCKTAEECLTAIREQIMKMRNHKQNQK